jgi:hypothetical protein
MNDRKALLDAIMRAMELEKEKYAAVKGEK